MSVANYIHYPKIRARLYGGPLDDYMDEFAEKLLCDGYVREMGRRKIWVVAHFSHWLRDRRIDIADINEQDISRFISERRKDYGRPYLGDHSALVKLLKLLREKGATRRLLVIKQSQATVIQHEFSDHLLSNVGLKTQSIKRYRPLIDEFLKQYFFTEEMDWSLLTVVGIRSFVSHYAKYHYPQTTSLMCTALRSFFRFLMFKSYVTIDFSTSVPSVARSQLSPSLPHFLSRKQLNEVPQQCDRETSIGKRNYAILLLLSRMGLRAKEVSSLKLQDINWQEGCMSITLKGGAVTQMPLSVDIGEAIVDYIQNGRPTVPSRHVFLRALAPHREFSSSANISMIATIALIDANIETPRKGSHLLRYSVATTLLQSGSSLTEIGQLLNHRHPDTTRLYAKVDLASLSKLAMSWPGGVR